ncbi:hypothetical protein ONS95_009978 [Cadophora gregata]|uniref:uncharacterized protein n=1 Tax=Cadophora gregata TaxID=51156 RepID=UPI0026DABF5E|nr:uncharacterized protein ONS95_009978 [Cadophora gregata]KAK0121693.1 hypothetical protein ONS95_009978 [Cadophora gregata]
MEASTIIKESESWDSRISQLQAAKAKRLSDWVTVEKSLVKIECLLNMSKQAVTDCRAESFRVRVMIDRIGGEYIKDESDYQRALKTESEVKGLVEGLQAQAASLNTRSSDKDLPPNQPLGKGLSTSSASAPAPAPAPMPPPNASIANFGGQDILYKLLNAAYILLWLYTIFASVTFFRAAWVAGIITTVATAPLAWKDSLLAWRKSLSLWRLFYNYGDSFYTYG